MQEGLVTTIIPVFNRPRMVVGSVGSVLAQTYRPIEIVIVDDGSIDETPAVLAGLAAKHPEVRVLRQQNGGPGPARETGRLAARGELIQYLDSDDRLLPRKFELQVAGLRAMPEAGVSYGPTRMVFEDGTRGERPSRRTGEAIATAFPAMLQERIWETVTPLYRRSVTDAAGPWLPLLNEEDWEYDARVAALGVRLHHTPEWIAEIHHHSADRLSSRGLKPPALRDRAAARALVLQHARRGGVPPEAAEMRHFARSLFLLARQAGNAGLAEQSKELFRLSRDAAGDQRNRPQYVLYAALARVIGWSLLGKAACLSDRLRS